MLEQQLVNSIRNDKSQMEVVNFMLNNVKMLKVDDFLKNNVSFKSNGDVFEKRYILVENEDGTRDLIVYSNEGYGNDQALKNDAFIIKDVKNFKAIENGKYFECEKDGFIIKNSNDASFRSLSIFKKGNEGEKLTFGDHGLVFAKFNGYRINYKKDCDLSINSLNKIYNYFNGGSIEYQGNDAEFLKNKLYEGLGISQEVNNRKKQQQNMLSPMNMMMNNQMFNNNVPMVSGMQNMSQQQNFISNGFNNNNFNNGNMNMFNNNFNNLNNINNNGGMISFGNNQNNMNVNNQQIINNNFNNNFNSNQMMMPRSNNMIVNNQMVNNNMMNQINNNNVNNNILFNRVQNFNNNQNQLNILNRVVDNNIQTQTVNYMCSQLDGFYNFVSQAEKGGIDIYREMNKRESDIEKTGMQNPIFSLGGCHNFGGNGIAGLGFQYLQAESTSLYNFNCYDSKHGNYEIKISFNQSYNGNMYLTIGDRICSVDIYDTSYDTVSLLLKISPLFKFYNKSKNIIEKDHNDLKRLIDRVEYLDNQKKIYESMKGIFFNGLIPSQKNNNRKIDNNWVFRLGQKNPLGNRKLCLNNNGTIDNSKYIQIYNRMPVLSQIKYCVQNFKKFYMMNTSRDKRNGYDVNSQIINALTQLYDFYYSSKSIKQQKQMMINNVATILNVNSSYLSTMLSNIYNIISSQQDKSLRAVAELIGNVCIDLNNDNNRDIWNGFNPYQQPQNNCVNNNISSNKSQIQNYQNQTTNNNNINLNNNQINNINNNNVNNIVNNFNNNNFMANNNNFNNNNLNYPNVQNQQKYNNNQNNFDRWKDNAIQQLNKEFNNNKPNNILLKIDNKQRVTEIKKKVSDGFIIFRPSQDEVFTEKEIDEIMEVDSGDKMDKLIGIKSFFLSTNNERQSRFCWNTNKNKVKIDMQDNVNDDDYDEKAVIYITFKKNNPLKGIGDDKEIFINFKKDEYSLDDFFNILEKKEIKQDFCNKYNWLLDKNYSNGLFDDLCNDFNKFKTIKNKENLENINQFIFDIDKIGTMKFLNLKGMIKK